MQTQAAHTVAFQPMTIERKVSGGEVAAQIREDGRTVYWMNGHRIDRNTAARKAGF
jgi:hypothetical protein